MGNAARQIADPFDVLPDVAHDIADPLDFTGRAAEAIGSGLGIGSSADMVSKASAEMAGASAQNTGPEGPVPNPFRRPRATPITAVQAHLDRRRSIASAMRRRRGAISILGGTPPGADPLGAA